MYVNNHDFKDTDWKQHSFDATSRTNSSIIYFSTKKLWSILTDVLIKTEKMEGINIPEQKKSANLHLPNYKVLLYILRISGPNFMPNDITDNPY